MKNISLVLLLAACSTTASQLPDAQLAPPGACPVGQSKVYRDVDVDRYYPANAASICAPTASQPPTGYARLSGDCNDNNANVHPNATEATNGVDDDCDGLIDEQPMKMQTISIDGQSIDDGLLVDLSAARDIRIAVWVDTTDVLTDTVADVDQSLSGEDHTVTLQSCTASPTVACPSPRGYVIVDNAATIVPDVREQTLLYELLANDGTAFRHRVVVQEAPRSPSTTVIPATTSATALDRGLQSVSADLTSEVDEAVRALLADLPEITVDYDSLKIELYADDASLTGGDPGEGTLDGSLIARVSLGDLDVDASCFFANIDDVAVVVRLSPRVPEYGASTSAGGWPSRYAKATLSAFTATWFDWNRSYNNIQGQSPWDWPAAPGELAFVVHDTWLTFGGQSVTVDESYDVIRDSIHVTGKDTCEYVDGVTETQVEDFLGEISYRLYSDSLVTSLRDESFGSWTLETAADLANFLGIYSFYETMYLNIDGMFQAVWDNADSPSRGLPLDRMPSVRNVLEYAINESLHAGLPTAGADPLINLDRSLPLGDGWALDLGLDTAWFTGTATSDAHASLVWSTKLTGAPATDSGVRYSGYLPKGDTIVGNPAEGPNGAFASLTVGETVFNQALYAVTTGGLLNGELSEGTTLQARVVPWADVNPDGELAVHLRGVEIISTVAGYQHVVADGDAFLQLHIPEDPELGALETAIGFDANSDMLLSAMASLELDSSTIRVTALKGRTVPSWLQTAVSGWLETALLEGVKYVACLAPDHFLPVDVDDAANYCAGDELTDTYWMYLHVQDAIGTISDGELGERLPGHYTVARMSDGLPQWDLGVVKAFAPYLSITKDGVSVPAVTLDLPATGTASVDLGTTVTRTFATGVDPSGVVWTSSESWLAVSSAGLVTVNANADVFDNGGFAEGTVTATWFDSETGLTLSDSVIVHAQAYDPGDVEPDCTYTTHVNCP